MIGEGKEGIKSRVLEKRGHYLHDRLSEILGAPITQARLEGCTDVVPVTARLVTILRCLDTRTHFSGSKGYT